MTDTDISRRRLLLAAAAGLTAPLLLETPSFADANNIRRLISNTAESEVGSVETGNNNYPLRYKLNGNIVRPAEWCGVFVNYCWVIGGATKKPSMKGSGTAQGHWATYWKSWANKNGRWTGLSGTPAIGDAVVYGHYADSGHIGIVVGVRGSGSSREIMTVEGNVSNKVTAFGWRKPSSMYVTRDGVKRYVSGYVRPV
ncbi:CHAP domain-containing protein [Micromonospora peucetia]|uniref:CHAP domain-containing protein n=1 Tax=Micromonospora peucetia TaxID=47871 RepID=A0A1C6VTV8_9ACTN|nr:CHAP domain-containing protein [Micromonospora peucetia]MCX4388184.1 CHAP domain-containing protein [Micromonospora peucetia]WSA31133.1 CHAP domain-containing protein [Micromonospora peucetia]SCL69725.1 CHAP domain-containing protein [Micromonospora peucetia]